MLSPALLKVGLCCFHCSFSHRNLRLGSIDLGLELLVRFSYWCFAAARAFLRCPWLSALAPLEAWAS